MAQPKETFLACVRPKFNVPGVNFDKLVTANCRFFKARADFKQYVIANALFRGEFQTKWNDDHTAQMMINTGKLAISIIAIQENPFQRIKFLIVCYCCCGCRIGETFH